MMNLLKMNTLKSVLLLARKKIRFQAREYIYWLKCVEIHHEWKNNSDTKYYYSVVTDKIFHQGLIHAKTGKSLSTRTILNDMFGLYPIWNVI